MDWIRTRDLEGYEMESQNGCLGPLGWVSKGSLLIFDDLKPNHLMI